MMDLTQLQNMLFENRRVSVENHRLRSELAELKNRWDCMFPTTSSVVSVRTDLLSDDLLIEVRTNPYQLKLPLLLENALYYANPESDVGKRISEWADSAKKTFVDHHIDSILRAIAARPVGKRF